MHELNTANPIDVLPEIPTIKLYSVRSITLATFFGGILAGGYLMAENFKAINDKKKMTSAWIATLTAIALIILSAFVRALDKVPSIAYSALFTILAGSLAKKYQAGFIDDHINQGGSYHSTGRVIVITVLGLVITLSVFIGIFFLLNPLPEA